MRQAHRQPTIHKLSSNLIGAARKFKTRVNFINYSKQRFSANELPKSYDDTRAFWDRWILLEFPYTFVTQKELDNTKDSDKLKLIDTDIIEKIATKIEMSGLLNWALDGLKRLLKNNDFSSSQSVTEVMRIWQRKSDSFAAFCEDYIEESQDGIISKRNISKYYSLYCKKHKVRPQGEKSVKYTLVTKYGATDTRMKLDDKQTYVWQDIQWNEAAKKEYR